MALEDFDQLREIVCNDPALLDRLRNVPDLPALMDAVIAAGRERDLEISSEDLHAVANVNRRSWLERWLHQ